MVDLLFLLVWFGIVGCCRVTARHSQLVLLLCILPLLDGCPSSSGGLLGCPRGALSIWGLLNEVSSSSRVKARVFGRKDFELGFGLSV